MNNIIDVLKSKVYEIREELLFNYKKIDITDSELIILIYIINQDTLVYNPKKISNDLNIDLNTILELVNSLCEKSIIEIKIEKKNNVRNEILDLNMLYKKIVLSLDTKEESKENNNIFSLFEKEFGRTLSPMEYEIINAWIDSGCSEELIILALKEATYNGVSNLRYIDKIIYEWGKKGIKTKEDVEKDRKKFKSNSKKKELFDYDWLNDENSN